ncbi:MAG: ZIP family metal transporter [Bryobacterales bacterium]|nr:ZIP family metal transporter [Bryobacterales bacterium]
MSLLAIKLGAAVSILAIGIVGGVIPLVVLRRSASHRFLSLGNSLAGGIFLGAGFIHLLPEADEALQKFIAYPLAPLLAAVGVGALLLIDRVLFEVRSHAGRLEGSHQPIYPVVLLVVLSMHSLVAGTALGLESTVATSVLVMIGILLHKGSAAFALMVSVLASGTSRRYLWVVLSIFVSMTPLGVALGTVASSLLEGRTAELIEGGFNALAAGTFIYVAILDVINAEMSRLDDRVARFIRSALTGKDDVPMPAADTDRVLKFILVLTGLASMAVLGAWV